jgi:hypothetical protein
MNFGVKTIGERGWGLKPQQYYFIIGPNDV